MAGAGGAGGWRAGVSCPNCGASMMEGRCGQCRAVVPLSGDAAPEGVEVRAGRLTIRGGRTIEVARVETIFAMPMASTRPQSVGHGSSWWVCAAAQTTRARVVLARGLSEEEAVRLARAAALRLGEASK